MKTKIDSVYEDFINVSTWTPGDCRGWITSYRVHGIGIDVNGKQIQVGDKVKVLFGGMELNLKFSWSNEWVEEMYPYIGRTFEVVSIHGLDGIELNDGSCLSYPWFCLEVVEQAKSTQVQPEQQGEGVGTMKQENSTGGSKTPVARWHSEISKMYYEDSSLVCQILMEDGTWKTLPNPHFEEDIDYRLIRDVESFKYIMYKPTEKGLTKIVYDKENVKHNEYTGWILIHTDFQHQTEVVFISEAQK